MEDRQLKDGAKWNGGGVEIRDKLRPIIFSDRRFEFRRLFQWLGTGCLVEGDL